MKTVDLLMNQAVADRVFPGGVILAAKEGEIRFFESYGYADLSTRKEVGEDTVFDLASLTKPLATTLAVLLLVQQSKLDPNQTIQTILPPFEHTPKGAITIEQLLTHSSGLPDYKPYYKALAKVPSEKRRDTLRELLVNEPLVAEPGSITTYSDLGFMILCWAIETVSGKRLDRFVADSVYAPLGLDLFFVDIRFSGTPRDFAATEQCSWRDTLLNGVVHDDNAYAAGGIEGHAGLFGVARDVYRLLSVLLDAYHGRSTIGLFDTALLRTFLTPKPGFSRAYGFDTPAQTDSSAGHLFSRNTVGHLGFTGTSFWMDLARQVIVILLTNRVHPSRDNESIREFRPRLHDAVMQSFESSS